MYTYYERLLLILIQTIEDELGNVLCVWLLVIQFRGKYFSLIRHRVLILSDHLTKMMLTFGGLGFLMFRMDNAASLPKSVVARLVKGKNFY